MEILAAVLVTIIFITWPLASVVRDKKRVEEAELNADIADWVEHIAKTTGRTNRIYKAALRTPSYEYTEYQIEYEVNGVTYYKWFDLYPGPDLGDIYGEGTSVLIKYSESDPDEFEIVSVLGDSIQMF